MGITGLLPLIKPICQQKHVNALAGKRVGIDVYGWLHKGVFSCATQVCRGLSTTAFVDYCMHRVRMLIHYRVVPVLVFDGADLPMKADTHAERKSRRDDARAKADAAYAAGDMRRAMEFYQRACAVTSDMARLVIRECRKHNIEYVVAPYEADAQLAWMLAHDHIAAVITEDSDLLAYGAHTVLYKMTRAGDGDLFDRTHLPSLDTISLTNFTDDMFIFMCVCAGCDFFKGVPGLGIRKSQPIVRRARTLARLVHTLRGKYCLSPTFAADFTRAYLVFRHQTVFDLDQKKTVSLTELSEVVRAGLPPNALPMFEDGTSDLAFLGKMHDPETARKVATALIHPRTLREYDEPLDIVPRTPTPFRRPRSFDPPAPRPSAPSREQHDAAPQQPVRGFAVQPASQPASSTQDAGYTPAANLRQRLAAAAPAGTSFNPRQAALAFSRRSVSAGQTRNARNPRAARSQALGVWAKFRPASALRQSDTSAADETGDTSNDRENEPSAAESPAPPSAPQSNEQATIQQSPADRAGASDAATSPQADVAAPVSDEQTNEPGQDIASPDGTQAVIDPTQSPDRVKETTSTITTSALGIGAGSSVTPARTEAEEALGRTENDGDENLLNDDDEACEFRKLYTNNLPSVERATKTGASSHRVEALNRVVGKFARPERDARMKFVPRSEKPPSPSRDAYDLFEELDANLSRDGAEKKEKPSTPAKLRQTGLSARTLGKKAITDGDPAKRRKSSDQLLVSRFFTSSDKAKPKPSTPKVKAPGLKRKRSASSSATTPSKQKATSTSLGTLDRFRRGASSKTPAQGQAKR